jgi:hypothetical protein
VTASSVSARVIAAAPPSTAVPSGSLAIVDELLRDRHATLARIEVGRDLPALGRVLLATLVCGAAMFGAALGSYRGGVQVVYAGLKVPLALLATAVICAPTLTAVSRALGRPASLARDLALLMTALAIGGLVLLTLAPVVLAARAAELGYHRVILVASGCAAVAAGASLRLLWRGVRARGPRGARTAILVLALVFAAVGAQVSWTLRPFLVRPQTVAVPFVRELDGSLYDGLRRSLRSAAGLYDPPRRPWHLRALDGHGSEAPTPEEAAP